LRSRDFSDCIGVIQDDMKQYGLIAVAVLVFGGYYYYVVTFYADSEYTIDKPTAYIDGATPPEIKTWEMY